MELILSSNPLEVSEDRNWKHLPHFKKNKQRSSHKWEAVTRKGRQVGPDNLLLLLGASSSLADNSWVESDDLRVNSENMREGQVSPFSRTPLDPYVRNLCPVGNIGEYFCLTLYPLSHSFMRETILLPNQTWVCWPNA